MAYRRYAEAGRWPNSQSTKTNKSERDRGKKHREGPEKEEANWQKITENTIYKHTRGAFQFLYLKLSCFSHPLLFNIYMNKMFLQAAQRAAGINVAS